MTIASMNNFNPAATIYINIWKEINLHIHQNQRKEVLLKRFAVSLLICAFSVIMIAEISSALIIQFHSKQIQISKEDTLEIGIKTPIKWFFRQVDLDTFQPIIDTYFPGIFKKTAIILPAPIQL